MPRPQDIQDLLDHREATEGEHAITPVPAPASVPMSEEDGKINNAWLKSSVVTTDGSGGTSGTIPVAVLPDTVVQLVNGKIPNAQLPNTITGKIYQSSCDGSAFQGTGFLLSNGQDLSQWIKAQTIGVNTVANSLVIRNNSTAYDYQCRFENAYLSIDSNNTRIVLNSEISKYNCNNDCGP